MEDLSCCELSGRQRLPRRKHAANHFERLDWYAVGRAGLLRKRAGSASAGRAGGGLASLLSAGRVRRPVPSRIYQCASPVPV